MQVASFRFFQILLLSVSFCSAHLCKLLRGLLLIFMFHLLLLLCALVQVASFLNDLFMITPHLLLLCALVQVASLMKLKNGLTLNFCSAHLCKLLRLALGFFLSKKTFCSAHLCKLLLRRAANGASDFETSALRTCASCFSKLLRPATKLFCFCSAHLCKLLLAAIRPGFRILTSALRTCASCFP